MTWWFDDVSKQAVNVCGLSDIQKCLTVLALFLTKVTWWVINVPFRKESIVICHRICHHSFLINTEWKGWTGFYHTLHHPKWILSRRRSANRKHLCVWNLPFSTGLWFKPGRHFVSCNVTLEKWAMFYHNWSWHTAWCERSSFWNIPRT